MYNTKIPESLRGCNTLNGVEISLAENISMLPMEIIGLLPMFRGELKNKGFSNGRYIHRVLGTNKSLLNCVYSLLHSNIICQQIEDTLSEYNMVIINHDKYPAWDDSLKDYLAELLKFRGFRVFNLNNETLIINAISYKTPVEIENIVNSFKKIDITCTIKPIANFDENYYLLLRDIIKSIPRLSSITQLYNYCLSKLNEWDTLDYNYKNDLLYKLTLTYLACTYDGSINVNSALQLNTVNVSYLKEIGKGEYLQDLLDDIKTLYDYNGELLNIEELDTILDYHLAELKKMLAPLFDRNNDLIQVKYVGKSEINSITYGSVKTTYKSTDDLFYNTIDLGLLETTLTADSEEEETQPSRSVKPSGTIDRTKLIIVFLVMILIAVIAKVNL